MGRQSRHSGVLRGYYGYSAVTDSMVLDDTFVSESIETPVLRPTQLPRVLIGIRNAFLLSAVLWALIIGAWYVLA